MTTHAHAARNNTDCSDQPLLFQDLGSRKVEADFSGGYLSNDGGVLLVRRLDQGLGLTRRLAGTFIDRRDRRYCDHALEELLAQRLSVLLLGYEDLNDHDTLRHDPLLAVAVNKREPLGEDRVHAHPPGVALAGSATLNRWELGNQKPDRTHKIQPQKCTSEGGDLLDFEGIAGVFDHATYKIGPMALAQRASRRVSIFLAASRNTFR